MINVLYSTVGLQVMTGYFTGEVKWHGVPNSVLHRLIFPSNKRLDSQTLSTTFCLNNLQFLSNAGIRIYPLNEIKKLYSIKEIYAFSRWTHFHNHWWLRCYALVCLIICICFFPHCFCMADSQTTRKSIDRSAVTKYVNRQRWKFKFTQRISSNVVKMQPLNEYSWLNIVILSNASENIGKVLTRTYRYVD